MKDAARDHCQKGVEEASNRQKWAPRMQDSARDHCQKWVQQAGNRQKWAPRMQDPARGSFYPIFDCNHGQNLCYRWEI